MASGLIPCPVCGAELHVLNRGGSVFVDCVHSHHLSTDPEVYEDLRVRAIAREIERFLMPGTATERCTDHEWIPIEEHPDLQFLICRRCLAVAVVASGP